MSNDIDNVMEQFSVVIKTTNEVLNEWNWDEEDTLQFPRLLGLLAVKMNWTDKEAREHDPIIRFYVRRDSEWSVSRGAYGGIMRASDKLKKAQTALGKNLKKQ